MSGAEFVGRGLVAGQGPMRRPSAPFSGLEPPELAGQA